MSYTEDCPWFNVQHFSNPFHLVIHIGLILLCFWLDPEGAKIGGSYLWHNEVDLTYPMLDIVEATSRRIIIIPHPITTTSNRIYVSYTLSLEGINNWVLVSTLFSE